METVMIGKQDGYEVRANRETGVVGFIEDGEIVHLALLGNNRRDFERRIAEVEWERVIEIED